MLRFFSISLLCLTAACALSSPAMASSSPGRFQMNHDIHIEAGDKIADVTCFHCSIYVRGSVSGDATSIGGNVVLYQGAQVAGDVTSLFGDVRVENGAMLAGDLTALGGTVRRDPQASVAGDIASLSGLAGLALIVILPLVVLGGFIALIVWLIQRNRRLMPQAAANRPLS